MNKVKIALGTNSFKKISLVRKILEEIGVDFEIFPIAVASGVSEQPISEEETLRGSVNRAKETLEKINDVDFALGIEVGYDLDENGKYEIFCYASILDKEGFSSSCCSQKFLLPRMHQGLIRENKKMSDYLEDYYKLNDHPATQYLARMIDTRETFIIESVRQAVLQYFRKEDY